MPQIKISIFTYLSLFLLAAYFDTAGAVSVLTSVLIHEAAHIVFITGFRCRIRRICISPLGISICRNGTSGSLIKELLIYLSGPAASALFFLLCYFMNIKDTAYVSLFYGVINLLPVKIFDGGKALGTLLQELVPFKADKIMKVISYIFILILWASSVFLMLYFGEYFSVFFISLFLFIELILSENRHITN